MKGGIKRVKRRSLFVALLLFAGLSLFYNRSVPPFEGPDEPQHFAYIIWLAEGKGLPPQGEAGWITPIQQEVGQAPLYYFLASLVVRLVEFDNPTAVFQRNPHFPSSAPGHIVDNKNIAVHYPVEKELQGGWLGLQMARGVSFLFGILLIIAVYLLAQTFFPQSDHIAAVSALFTAVIPQVLFMSNVVSNDIAAGATGALTLWLLARLVLRGPTLPMGLAFGIAFGLSSLTKTSNLSLALPAAAGFVWLWWQEKEQRGKILQMALIAAGSAILIAGWWYLRNWLLYDSPFGLGAHYLTPWALEKYAVRPDPLAQWVEVFYSLWAAFGWGNIKFPGWVYYPPIVFSLLAVVGLIYKVRKEWRGWQHIPVWLFVSILAVGAVVIALELWMRQVTAPHGRLLYPALAAITLLLIVGWRHIHPRLSYIAIGYFFVLSCIALVLLIQPAYALPEFLPEAAVQGVDGPELNWQFGDFARLVSVTPIERSAAAGDVLPVSVCWQTTGRAEMDYAVFLQLVGPENQVVGGRQTYPGLGSYPTSTWEAGQQFCDLIRVDIPADLARTLLYQIEVGIVAQSGERVPATNAGGGPQENLFASAARLETAEPSQLAQTPAGDDAIRLAASEFNAQWPVGTSQTVTLHWWLAEPVNQNYTVFVHLRDRDSGENVAQGDGPPVAGWYPTSIWETGEMVEDIHGVMVTADLPPGSYDLAVGWYDPVTGERLGSEVSLGTVEVVP